MDVGAISSQSAQAAQSQTQVGVLKQANDQQAKQVQQLLQAQAAEQARAQQQVQAKQAAAATGQPGSVINTYA